MPPRPDAFKRCWQISELLILPFLAPRVFAPWPSRYTQRRASSGFQTPQTSVTTGYNSRGLEKKEVIVTKWLQGQQELKPSPKNVNDEECNARNTRGTLGVNSAKGVESLMLERTSIQGRYLRQRRPSRHKVVSDRGTLPILGLRKPAMKGKGRNQMKLDIRAQVPNLLAPPAPRKEPEKPPRIVRYLSSVKEELKLPIVPSFFGTTEDLATGTRKAPDLINRSKSRLLIRKNISSDLRSKIMFNTYFADQLIKTTHSRSIRRRSAPMARVKKFIAKKKLIRRETSKSAQKRKVYQKDASKIKSRKGRTFEKPKQLTSQAQHPTSTTGAREDRKGGKCTATQPSVQEPMVQEPSNRQVHCQTFRQETKKLRMLSPRKSRRYILQRCIINALEARRKELRRLQRCNRRQPVHTRHITEGRQAWHRRFSLVQPNHAGFMMAWMGSPRRSRQFPTYRNTLPVRFKVSLAKLRPSRRLGDFWEKVPQPIRVKYWHDIMCFTLKRYPKSGLNLLVATYIKPYPAGYAVSNCIDFIISYYLGGYIHADTKSGGSKYSYLELTAPINWNTSGKRSYLPRQLLGECPNPLTLSKLAAAVVFLLQTGPQDVQINRGSQYLLATTLDADNLEVVYKSIPHHWGVDHLFTIADRFAKARKSVMALDVLGKLEMYPGVDFNSRQMHLLFSTLLRFQNRDDANSYSDTMIWDFMTCRGLVPVTQHYNILIQNSFLRADSDTCWSIYNAMLEDGVTPDVVTYSILLTYSKSLMNRVSVQRTLGLVKAKDLQMNPYIATDHLHSIFLFYRQDYESDEDGEVTTLRGPPRAFEQMLPVYCRYFDPRPLVLSLGPLAKKYPELNQPPFEMTELMEPPKHALTVMFIGLLYGFTEACQVVEAYSYFRSLLSHRDPNLVARLHQSHIYDCFLMRLGKFSETVDKCPKVVEDMLTSSKSKLPSISRNENEDFYLNLTPTVYTWNILLQIYASRGQMTAGRRVLQIMQERGIEPTAVTWATLATGYSWIQDIPGTLEAVDHLAKLGQRDHPVGVHALNKIKDTRALYAIMEAREARHQDEHASNEDSKVLSTEDELAKKDELERADELAGKRLQLIGEAAHDTRQGSWQKRRYWEHVFREASAAREAAGGIQPLIPDSALNGSQFLQKTVESLKMSDTDRDKISDWTPLWNETI